MKCEWRNIRLSEITSLITKGTTPTSIGYSFTERGVNFVKSESITASRRLDKNKYCHISEITHERLKRSQLQVNDILFSMAGMFLGKTAIVTEEDLPANTNQAVAIIRIIPELADIKYIYYYLNQKEIVLLINSATGQSAQPNINLKQIGNLDIKLPDLGTQRKISAILNSIDEKIELNNKINANLQQQAQAIFKSWFVDFEPFQDGEFVESELGPIPKGWSVGRLADICTYGKDKIAVSELTPENYFSTENMLANKGGHTSAASLPNVLQTTRCVPGDTLISNIRPYFKKIVYCTMKAGCSTDVLCLRPKHPKYSTYLYNLAYSDIFFDYMVAGSKGTKMPRGDKQQIMSYPVILPPDKVIAQFHEFADAALKKIRLASEENKKLTVLRDGLLPKLMSGELSINEEVGS